jgi:hypothetical protein
MVPLRKHSRCNHGVMFIPHGCMGSTGFPVVCGQPFKLRIACETIGWSGMEYVSSTFVKNVNRCGM